MKDKENEKAHSEQITEKKSFSLASLTALEMHILFSSEQKNSFKLKWHTKKKPQALSNNLSKWRPRVQNVDICLLTQ